MKSPYAAATSPRFKALASSTGSEAAGNANVPHGRINPRTGTLQASRSESVIGSNGDLNASNKSELMQAMTVLQHHVQNGAIKKAPVFAKTAAERQAQHQRLVQAFNAPDKKGMQVIGEVMADEIWQTLGREGFARKLMAIKQLAQGETGRLKVRKKDVVAYIAISSTNVVPSTVRQFYVYPPEFNINCSVLMEDKDIAQSSGDLLEEKYQDGLEQIMKKEDDLWMQLARASATAANDMFFFSTLTPAVFSEMQIQVNSWGIPPATSLIAFDLWNDIRTDSEFASYFDPVTKHELIMEGSLGTFFGMQIITDAYKHDTLRVLNNGEMFVLGAPQALGGITIRQELASKAIDKYAQEKAERGWFMSLIEGMSIVSPRGLVRGQKI
jgi:hypothetical protein